MPERGLPLRAAHLNPLTRTTFACRVVSTCATQPTHVCAFLSCRRCFEHEDSCSPHLVHVTLAKVWRTICAGFLVAPSFPRFKTPQTSASNRIVGQPSAHGAIREVIDQHRPVVASTAFRPKSFSLVQLKCIPCWSRPSDESFAAGLQTTREPICRRESLVDCSRFQHTYCTIGSNFASFKSFTVSNNGPQILYRYSQAGEYRHAVSLRVGDPSHYAAASRPSQPLTVLQLVEDRHQGRKQICRRSDTRLASNTHSEKYPSTS
jgi:hypothetical protein